VIEYGGSGRDGNILCNNASPTIRDCIIRNSKVYGIYVHGASAKPLIRNNIITQNSIGINCSSSAMPIISGRLEYRNIITENTDFGVFNDTRNLKIDARYNWWGSPSGPTHAGNPKGNGDKVSDYVDYDPWIGKVVLSITPASGTVGCSVTVSGKGYDAGELIRIDFGRIQSIASATATAAGTFTTTFVVNTQLQGTVTITATGLSSNSVGTGVFVVTAPEQEVELTVTSVSPQPNTTLVNVCTPIIATFSTGLNPNSINANTMIIRKGTNTVVAGTYTISNNAQRVTFIPYQRLEGDTKYSGVITTDVCSAQGSRLAATYTWQFTTTLPGDADSSGKVDGNDLMELGWAFGADPAKPYWNWCVNFEKDNYIDGNDLMVLGVYFGKKSRYWRADIEYDAAPVKENVSSGIMSIGILPETVQVLPQDIFTVNITVNDVTDVYGIGFDLRFNPNVVEVIKVEKGEFLVQDDKHIMLLSSIDNDTGEVVIGISCMGQVSTGMTGSGVIAKVTMKALRCGDARIQINNCSVKNTILMPVNIRLRSSSVMVGDTTAAGFVLTVCPNPVICENNVKFKFNMPDTGKVTLRIFNIAGELINTIEQNISAGIDKEILWNIADIASGIYIYHFVAEYDTGGDDRVAGKIGVVK
jgi:parallel beta-helix repeat protein